MMQKWCQWTTVALVLVCLILTACGPSPEDQTATVVALTAAVATNTPALTPTSTPRPSPTPTPEPDAFAPIDWQRIGMPSTYYSWHPAPYEIGTGEMVMEAGDIVYTIQGSFVFSDDERLKIYGYTFDLPSADHIEILDFCLADFSSCWSGSPIPVEGSVGESSAAILIPVGSEVEVEVLMFRVGSVGAAVFLRHPVGQELPVDLYHLASVYAESIRDPHYACEIVSVLPVEGEGWPTFAISAAGFYPGEGRAIFMEGDFIIGGEVQSAVTALLGGQGQSFDLSGGLEEVIRFNQVTGDNVEIPNEFHVSVIGQFSGCIAEGDYLWMSGE